MKCLNIAVCSKILTMTAAMAVAFMATTVLADETEGMRLKEDKQQVHDWNLFADRLLELHKFLVSRHEIRTDTSQGGYARQANIYTETRYYDKQSKHLLSRIQRMNDNPKLIELIEINIYGKHDKIKRDYLAAYLPYNRNAPIQTLINLHGYHKGLHGFRQFDASGERIYEQCRGHFKGKAVMMSLEDYEFGQGPYRDTKTLDSEAYKTCFAGIPTKVEPYLNPLNEIALIKQQDAEAMPDSADELARQIADYSRRLKQNPKDVALLIKRGDLYFKVHEFELAIADYSDAIELDGHADEAYFGRGMALGRYGQIREGIKDLGVYIKRHPDNSRAYTKRGVRYLWIHDYRRAEKDLVRAIQLDPANAEAHDDLGVIHARNRDYIGALKHFNAAVKYDHTYFKAFHNQAMVYYITGQEVLALASVEQALALMPDQRNSLLLKANILHELGRDEEAAKIKDDAEFLPKGNWSERITVQ